MEKSFVSLTAAIILLIHTTSRASDLEAAKYSCKHVTNKDAVVWEIVDKTDATNQIGGSFEKQSDCQSALKIALHDPDDIVCTPAGPLNKFFRLFDLDGGEAVGSWSQSCASAVAERARAKDQPSQTETSELNSGSQVKTTPN